VLMSLIDASMCACECFCFCKLMINVDEIMYYTCSTYNCMIRIISVMSYYSKFLQGSPRKTVQGNRRLGGQRKRLERSLDCL